MHNLALWGMRQNLLGRLSDVLFGLGVGRYLEFIGRFEVAAFSDTEIVAQPPQTKKRIRLIEQLI